MDIVFQTENLGNSLMLMLMGMVGIFVVMCLILVVVVLLNKFTDEKKAEAKRIKKEEKAKLKENMRNV